MPNTEELYNKVKDRVYVIKWDFEILRGGVEKRTEYYAWEDREKAIQRYVDLKVKWYASGLRFLVAEPKEVDIETIIGSI